MRVEGQTKSQDVYPSPAVGKKHGFEAWDRPITKKEDTDKPGPSQGELRQAVEVANQALRISNYHLEFIIPEDNSRYQVKVVDTESGEIIRKIPSDIMMKFSENIKKSIDKAIGLLFDEFI